MKPRLLSIILIFSLALNLAVLGTFIFRKIEPLPGPEDGPPFDPQRLPFFDDMTLDENQRNQMRQLMHQFRQSNRENRQMIFELEDKLIQTLRAEEFDSVRVDSLIDEIGQLRMAQTRQAIKHFRKFNKFLSPRQQEHFQQMIMERPGRHQGRLHRGRDSRGMPGRMRGDWSPDSVDRPN